MDGVLLLDKPSGMTSHDVVNLVRRAYNTKKVGHAGTLDPDATGLLILGINNGTKILNYLIQDDKEYDATICFGIATDTLDKTGEVLIKEPVSYIANIDRTLKSFEGHYHQIPPMFSAIKYNGKRLYEYARQGIDIPDRPTRDITIHSINRISEVTYEDDVAYVSYRVHGSKGLYVRTLSYDIGRKCGYPAHNYTLNRVRSGRFLVDESYSIEDLKNGETELLSMTDALCKLPKLLATKDMKEDIRHGRYLDCSLFESTTLTRLVDKEDTLLALYDLHPSKPLMKAMNVFLKD